MVVKTVPDPLVEQTGGKTTIRQGTPLARISAAVDEQPLDQESVEFFVGDIRDVCVAVGDKDKTAVEMRDSVKGKPVGEKISLPIASVKQLIASALRSGK